MRWIVTLALLAAAAWFAYTRGAHLAQAPSPAPPGHVLGPDGGAIAAEDVPEEPERLVELAPPLRPGETIEIELIEPPVLRYADPTAGEADAVYSDIIDGLGRADLVYDPGLGRAARELAYQHSVLSGLVPPPVVNFLLRSSGAVDRTVTQGYTATGGDDLSAVSKRLEGMLADSRRGVLHRVGVGEAYIPGAKRPRYIAILVSQRQIDINPVPRRADPGTTWVLTGMLPRGWENASGIALYPDGLMETIKASQSGRRFTLRVPTGKTTGMLEVSVGAVGPMGPSPLVQLPVFIGVDPPTTYTAHAAADESDISGRRAAEALAFRLLNADRARFGLPALIRDSELDGVALDHSLDMRDNNFFGHWSENSGTPGDRLAAVGYRAVTHGENVASSATIHSAEEGLMHSLGHRRNILNRRFTRVGIGVAGRLEGQRTTWYLTQMFARAAVEVDPQAAGRRLFKRVQAARSKSSSGVLKRSLRLDRLADAAARVGAAGGNEQLARDLMDSAKAAGETRGGAYAWVRVVTELDSLELPPQATSDDYSRVGISVDQLDDHPNGLIGVAVLFTGRK